MRVLAVFFGVLACPSLRVFALHHVGVGTARLREKRAEESRASPPASNAKFLTQPLDHFDYLREYNSTWQQRYWVNSTFFQGEDAPVFLCVGGESRPMSDLIVVNGEEHCSLMITAAEEHGALILALEHRYYGPVDSYPVEDLSTENLQYLSSQQALADIANLHMLITKDFGLGRSNRWITWGGSYPGMMASWARYKYPHLIFASVASSAPVEAIVEMTGYNEVVAKAIATTSIGGSPECLAVVKDAFSGIGSLLKERGGREQLYQLFNVCDESADPLSNKLNADEFTMDLSFLVYSQMNDPASKRPTENLAITCGDFLLNENLGGPVTRLAALNKEVSGSKCMGVSYEENQVKPLQVTKLEDAAKLDGICARCWEYQTCTMFGFYQTCDPDTGCPFTSDPWLNTLQSQLLLCQTSFGIAAKAVPNHVKTTLARLGGRYPDAQRILYVNGEVDPWRSQSVLKARPGLPVLDVPGASHHPWTHPAKPTDQESVKDARKKILYQVAEWLEMASWES